MVSRKSIALLLVCLVVLVAVSHADSHKRCGKGTGFACGGEDGCPKSMKRCKLKENLEKTGSSSSDLDSISKSSQKHATSRHDDGADGEASAIVGDKKRALSEVHRRKRSRSEVTSKDAGSKKQKSSGEHRLRHRLRKSSLKMKSPLGFDLHESVESLGEGKTDCPDRQDCGPGTLFLCGGYNGCPKIYSRCRVLGGKNAPKYCYSNTDDENSRCKVQMENKKRNDAAGMSHEQWGKQHKTEIGERKTILEDPDIYTSGKRCSHSCQHGGTMTHNYNDKEPCRCTCKAPWGGESCHECQIKCLHGKPSKSAKCKCLCEPGFKGPTCAEVGCSLKCQNHGILDENECKCNCINGWRGRECRRKDWCYDDPDCGSGRWGMLDSAYAKCNDGGNQSPVEIASTSVIRDMYMSLLEVEYRGDMGGELNLKNFRLSVKVDNGGNNYVRYNKVKYHASRVTFHWPGEHIVNGHRADMEIQIQHKASRGRKLNIALPIHLTETDNPVFAPLVEAIPPITNTTDPVELKVTSSVSLPLIKLLSISREHRATTNFYKYEGSMTTPPCQEHVTWIVLKNQDIASMSLRQFTHITDALFFHNARPLKPLKRRKVFTHAYGDSQITKNVWTYDARPSKAVPYTDPMCTMGKHQTPIDITDYEALMKKYGKEVKDEAQKSGDKDTEAVGALGSNGKPYQDEEDTTANLDNMPVLHSPSVRALVTFYNIVPKLTLEEDEHLVYSNIPPGSTLQVQDSLFELKSVQVHSPGLHRVNGEDSALEVIFEHENSSGKVMMSTLFRVGEKSEWVQQLLDGATSINPVKGLPDDPNYYMYDGSLCTPPGPCTEGVRWVVMKEIQTASSEQVEAIFSRMPAGHDSRRTQRTNRRLVASTSFPVGQLSKKSHIRKVIPIQG